MLLFKEVHVCFCSILYLTSMSPLVGIRRPMVHDSGFIGLCLILLWSLWQGSTAKHWKCFCVHSHRSWFPSEFCALWWLTSLARILMCILEKLMVPSLHTPQQFYYIINPWWLLRNFSTFISTLRYLSQYHFLTVRVKYGGFLVLC